MSPAQEPVGRHELRRTAAHLLLSWRPSLDRRVVAVGVLMGLFVIIELAKVGG